MVCGDLGQTVPAEVSASLCHVVLVRHTSTDVSRTRRMPVTDRTVSISDHDLMLSPTETLKYSLMSQNPASLTWEKNTEPQPTARTSRAACGPTIVAASGSRMPADVNMATVDDPLSEQLPDPGVDEDLLDPAAGGDNEKYAGNRGKRVSHALADGLTVHA